MIEQIDTAIYSMIYQLNSSDFTFFMLIITNMASAVALISLTILFYFLLKDKRDSKYIFINLVAVFLLNQLLKIIFNRNRPINVLKIVEEGGYSFPSAHSMVGIAFYGFLIYIVAKRIKNNKIKIPLIILISGVILLIGISRIYLGAHYGTDVIGGFIFGIIYLCIFVKFVYDKKKE